MERGEQDELDVIKIYFKFWIVNFELQIAF
jgi:hypothetical protein